MAEEKKKITGYDKFVDWKLFTIPLGLLILMLAIPTPRSMLDVGVEVILGPKYVQEHFAKELFGKPTGELAQWEVQMVRMMDGFMRQASFGQDLFLKADERWCRDNKVPSTKKHLEQVLAFAREIPAERFEALMRAGYQLRTEGLTYDALSEGDKARAETAGFHVKVAVGIVLFVVGCFVTESIPLPIVSFCLGIIALCTGIVTRNDVAGLYWSDATWFIMGSLMFATAFVKTGVDKRIAMAMFGRLKNLDIKWVTLAMMCVIAPLSMFMSDHALAAMFLPIGMMLYATSTAAVGKEDPELGKLLMMAIAMGCNLAGSLAPSGAARNIIMMNYTEQMFGIQIGFGQWCLYLVPMLFLTLPLAWLVLNWRFKPVITDLTPSMVYMREEINRVGGGKWTRDQILTIGIFALVFFSWITEKNLILQLTGIRFGLGALAVMGAVAYIFAGIANWRDYQTKVDWGVVWLYAGAIIFGDILVRTGGAYWIARTLVEFVAGLGLNEGLGLIFTGNVIVGVLTQFMADGPACAAVGPVTLSMAGIMHPGTSMIPFVAMSTSYSSSLAYCLIIGTPPNAIVYASGYLEPKDYFRTGLILWFVNMAIMMLLITVYWQWMGFPGLKPF
jgi:solute carrier family 13 (sodium-dependent dicarboxylate transporter), member 2/3/5